MDNWNEIRTAAHVARLGTISAAADALGVHRATVTRHIDTLESKFGAKLFQRHKRGFTPTELGQELLRVADATDEQFSQLNRQAKGQSDALDGELIITSIDASLPRLMPILQTFRERHPAVSLKFLSSGEILKLEYGEAHVAFRAGDMPQDPDNIVRPFGIIDVALYATQGYLKKFGTPKFEQDFENHHFVGFTEQNPRIPFLAWLHKHVPAKQITFTGNQLFVLNHAVLAGFGIGFLATDIAQEHSELVQILPPRPEWQSQSWRVTHVDLHRTAKVQAFLQILKEYGY